MTKICKNQLKREWMQDQLDPDNWFVIPEFGVNPSDVSFIGFEFPIVHPSVNFDKRQVRLQVRELVKRARNLARKDFFSLVELRASFIEVLDKFELDLDDIEGNTSQKYSDQNAAAFAYDCTIRALRKAVENDLSKYEALLELALAANSLTEWMAGNSRASLERLKLIASLKARKAANALHAKAGGSIDKQNKIRAIWATGKFTNRDLCAEQECAALGMSFSTARKALRNTPKPI